MLRVLGMRPVHAAPIALLVLLFPLADSVRLWASGSAASLAICLYLAGLLLALEALPRRGPWALAMHAGSVLLYAASLMSYEFTLVPVLLSVLLYWRREPGPPALWRWVADVVAMATVLGLATAQTTLDREPLSALPERAVEVSAGALSVLSWSVFPLGDTADLSPARLIGGLIVIVVLGAALARVRRGQAAELRPWLMLAAAATLVAAAGYVVLIAAADYNPAHRGIANRVNVFAALGIAMLVYALVMLAALQLGERLRRPAAPIAIALTALLVVGYAVRLQSDQSSWRDAADAQERVLDDLADTRPPPPGGGLAAFRVPAFAAPGVPVFHQSWDMTGAAAPALGRRLPAGLSRQQRQGGRVRGRGRGGDWRGGRRRTALRSDALRRRRDRSLDADRLARRLPRLARHPRAAELSAVRRLPVLALGAILAAAAAVRLGFLSVPVRPDEALTFLRYASQPWHEGLADYSLPNNHLLNTLAVHASWRVFGQDEWTLRLFALVAGIATVPATFVLGRELYGRQAALWGAALVAGSSALIQYSANGRGYMPGTFFVVAAMACASWAARTQRALAWTGFGAFSVLAVYSVPSMAVGVLVAAIWVAVNAWPGRLRRRTLRELGMTLALSALAGAALYAPTLGDPGWTPTGGRGAARRDARREVAALARHLGLLQRGPPVRPEAGAARRRRAGGRMAPPARPPPRATRAGRAGGGPPDRAPVGRARVRAQLDRAAAALPRHRRGRPGLRDGIALERILDPPRLGPSWPRACR